MSDVSCCRNMKESGCTKISSNRHNQTPINICCYSFSATEKRMVAMMLEQQWILLMFTEKRQYMRNTQKKQYYVVFQCGI